MSPSRLPVSGDDAHRRRWGLAALAVVVVLGIVAAPPFIDDAYISLRYAQKLASGDGLVFNPGEWVEGYSNLSWVLVSAAVLAMGWPIETGLRLAALCCCAATIALLWRYASRRGLPVPVAVAGTFAVASSLLWVRSSLNGLEGPLFALITMALVVLSLPSARVTAWRGVGIGIVLALAAVTRPEGQFLGAAYFAGLGATIVLGSTLEPPPVGWRIVGVAVLTLVVGLGVIGVWRYTTYQMLVPNTVVAKLGGDGLLTRPLWLYGFGVRYVLWFAAGVAPLLLAAAGLLGDWRRLVLCAPPLALLAFGTSIPIPNGGDWMPDSRLIAPYIPIAGLLAAEGLAALTRRHSSRTQWAVAACLIVASTLTSWTAIEKKRSGWGRQAPLFRPERFWSPDPPSAYGLLGAALNRSAWPAGAGIASEVLGELSFYAADRHITDLSGLTDRTIAREEPVAFRFGRKTRPSTLRRLAPELIVVNDFGYWESFAGDPWFSDRYDVLACETFFQDGLYALIRRQSPLLSGPPLVPSCQPMAMKDALEDVRRFRVRPAR